MQVVEELRSMSDERFLEIYEGLSDQGFGPLDGEVAKALKFRPQAIRKLPMPQRARKARAILLGANNAELAYELIGSFLMRTKKELITGFLDKTGGEHEDGMIGDIGNQTPDPEKLGETISALDEEFGAEDVTMYLAMCATQWPGEAALAEAWQSRRVSS